MYITSQSNYEDYVGRDFRTFEQCKRWTDPQIEYLWNKMNLTPVFHTKPYHHQKVCFTLGMMENEFLFFADMGLGKTKIICDIFTNRKLRGEVDSMLVIVPFIFNLESWSMEMKKHAPDLKFHIAYKGSKDFINSLNDRYDVRVVTRQTFLYALTRRQKLKGTKLKSRRVKEQEVTEKLLSQCNMLVIDEIDHLKNPDSKTFRLLRNIAPRFKVRFGMTGTPFGKSPHDVWAQYRLIDLGRTFKSLREFRKMFFIAKPTPFGIDYRFKRECAEDFRNMLRNASIRYEAGECMDLPEVVRTDLKVTLTGDLWKEYNKVVNDIQAATKMEVIKNGFVRLRQLSSGFVTFKGNDDSRLKVLLDSNPKLYALYNLMVGIREEDKVIIFHEFIKSGDMISSMLDDMDIGYVRFYSGTKDKVGSLKSFMEDPSVRVAVANSVSASVGLNLQMANYVIFFETPVSPRIRSQAEARCIRHGQKKTVFVYDLIASGTIDYSIIHSLREGLDLFDRMVNAAKAGDRDGIEKMARGLA